MVSPGWPRDDGSLTGAAAPVVVRSSRVGEAAAGGGGRPDGRTSTYLAAIADVATRMPPEVLADRVDYVLFPVRQVMRRECERQKGEGEGSEGGGGGGGGGGETSQTTTPAGTSRAPSQTAEARRVLEEAVACVGAVLRRCGEAKAAPGGRRGGGVPPDHAVDLFCDVVAVLAHATDTAIASRADSSASASSGSVGASPFSSSEDLLLATVSALRETLAFIDGGRLGSDQLRPVFGYAVSLLLAAAHREASAGNLGSKACRSAALVTLDRLVEALGGGGDPDVVAFFLPGIVSGAARAVSANVGSRANEGAGPGGAAGDSAAAVAAVRVLHRGVVLALADDVSGHLVGPRGGAADDAGGADGGRSEPVGGLDSAGALASRLRTLVSSRRRRSTHGAAGVSSSDDEEEEGGYEGPPSGEEPGTDEAPSRRLRVRRTRRWLRATAPRVEAALCSALASLVTHPKPSVRSAAGDAAVDVLRRCRRTLLGASRRLLDAALVLSGDPWPAVASSAGTALRRVVADGVLDRALVHDVFRDAFAELPRALRRQTGHTGSCGETFDGPTDGSRGRAVAQKLLAAMRVAGPADVSSMLLTNYGVRTLASTALVRCFAVAADLGGASSRSDAAWTSSRVGVRHERVTAVVSDTETTPRKASPTETTPRKASPTQTTQTSAKVCATNRRRAPCLPRMPPRMLYLEDPSLYAAVAAVARALGSHRAALHSLVDLLLGSLRGVLQDARAAHADQSDGGTWQRSAAAHVIALNELLRGARAAATGETEETEEDGVRAHLSDDSATVDDDAHQVHSAARAVLEEYLSKDLWNLSTSADDVGLGPSKENAFLARLVMEGVGVVAETCGEGYVAAASSAFLPAVLCPLLQRLGDPATGVSDCAAEVLRVIALEGGFDGRDDADEDETRAREKDGHREGGTGDAPASSPVARLVAANADYVVDMLSRHLRHLDDHPLTSRFFAAVLGRRTGATRAMLPLLHEPVRRAIDALGVGLRHRHWAHAATFLGVLREVSAAVEAEGRVMAVSAVMAADAIRPLGDLLEEMETFNQGETEDTDANGSEGASDAAGDADGLAGIIARSPHRAACEAIDIPAAIAEWNRRVRQQGDASRLASDILVCAAPLLESSDVRVRRVAAEVSARALGAVSAIDGCSKPEETVFETVKKLFPHEVPETHAEEKKPVKLLPHVHKLWPHLVASLGAPLGPQVHPEPFKASLEVLEVSARVSGGQFIARRVATDLWPHLVRVLRVGVPHTDASAQSLHRRMDMLYLGAESDIGLLADSPSHAPTASDDAPQKTEAVRRAILSTIATIAADERGRDALLDVAAAATEAILPFATGAAPSKSKTAGGSSRAPPSAHVKHSAELRRCAAEALKGLAGVDEDAVWTSLALNATGHHAMPTPVAPTWIGGEHDDLVTLPTFREISPLMPRSEEVQLGVAQASLRIMVGCGFASLAPLTAEGEPGAQQA